MLSDAYSKKMEVPNLELRVKVWNINLGNSEEIYKKSRTMHDYMIFVDKTRRYSEQYPLEDAIEQTVEECIREGVLRDFLQANRAEVKKMCLYEYDEEQQRKWDREEGREEGREEEKRIMAERLLEQKLLPEEKIMEVVGFTVEEWNEVKEELEKKKNNVE